MSKQSKSRAERAADLLSFYTIDELSDSMNVSKTTVRNWIKGKSQPNDENYKKIYRREYYYKKERAVFRDEPRKVKGKAIQSLEIPGGIEVYDAIRRIQSGEFDLTEFKGNKYFDFNFAISDGEGGFDEVSLNFINPGKKIPDESDLVSFLYRIFRQGVKRFGGSNVQMFIEEIEALG